MSTVTPVSSLFASSSTQQPAAPATTGTTDLGQTDFMKLLITQLQQQDPLNPQDPSQFASQLAQFSSLQQMTGLNSSINNMSTALSNAITGLQMLQLSSNSTQAVAFVGKNVQYSSNQMQVASGSSPDLELQASQDLHNVTVTLTNSAGQVVKTINLGNVAQGLHSYNYASLGGLTGVPDGQYTIAVNGLDSTGAAATASPLLAGQVTSVSFVNGVTYAQIAGTQVPISSIYSVS